MSDPTLRTPGAPDVLVESPPGAPATETILSPIAETQQEPSTPGRRAHRHHHGAGHRGGSRRHHHHQRHQEAASSGLRLHHHHHHHHRCCERQVDQACPDHGDSTVLRSLAAGTAPHSATFGSFPRQGLQGDADDGDEQGDLHRPPRTAPLPYESRLDSARHGEPGRSRGDVGSGDQTQHRTHPSRNLLRAEGTPAPSYRSQSPSAEALSAAAVATATARPSPIQQRMPHTPARSYTDGSFGFRSESSFGTAAAAEAVGAVPVFRVQARRGQDGQERFQAPHVHFMRSGSNTTQMSSATSGVDAGSLSSAPVHQSPMDDRQGYNPRESISGLQHRDRRFSYMVDDVVRDPRMTSAERTLRKRKKQRASIVDSVLGFDEMTPGDLIYNEGSKVDGGFGFAIPSSAREGTVLLDSRPERTSMGEESLTSSSRFSADSTSTVSSTLSRIFGRRGTRGQSMSQSQTRGGARDRGSTNGNSNSTSNGYATSTSGGGNETGRGSMFGRGQGRFRPPTTLSERVNSANLRPSKLDLNRQGARGGREPTSNVRASVISAAGTEYSGIDGIPPSTWEDVQLDSGKPASRQGAGAGKNDRLADALGVRRPRRPATQDRFSTGSSSDLTVINEEEDDTMQQRGEKGEFAEKDTSSYYHHQSQARQSDAEGYRQTMNLPPGLSQADIVAICLVQGMVPPGLPPDDTLVTWSGPLSPTNPRNWSPFQKWYACILVSWSTFLANAATNMIAPALGLMSVTYKELYIMAIRGLLIGCYIFAFTFSPLIFGPLSEIIGRKPVLIAGMTLFTLASTLSGLVTASWQLMILRFLAALGASAPMSIGGAVLTDIFSPDQRGRAMLVFALAPQLGPVLGPMMGGWVTQEVRNWRWIFFISAICGFIAAAPMLFVRESYTPRILARRAQKLRKETGNQQLSTIFERRQESKRQIMTRGVVRPLVLFSCEPIVQLLTVYVSLIYGIIHLVVATFPAVFGTIYSEYPGWASMHFIGIGVGTISGGFLGGYLVERHYHQLSRWNGGVAKPEFKFYCMLYTVWIPPLGLMIYGVITYFGIHWIFADLGIVIFCCGISIAVVAVQSYMVDCYALLAGSALTATIVFRSIVGTGATIGAEDLLLHAGMLWSNVALAASCILIGVPAAYICYFWGPAMRQKSRHATHKR